MIGVTENGFKFEVDEERLDNMELVDALADFDEGNPLAVSKVVALLLGKDEKKKMYDFARTEKGVVPATVISKMILEILSAKKEVKN